MSVENRITPEKIAKVDALLAALADQAETWDGDQ